MFKFLLFSEFKRAKFRLSKEQFSHLKLDDEDLIMEVPDSFIEAENDPDNCCHRESFELQTHIPGNLERSMRVMNRTELNAEDDEIVIEVVTLIYS